MTEEEVLWAKIVKAQNALTYDESKHYMMALGTKVGNTVLAKPEDRVAVLTEMKRWSY